MDDWESRPTIPILGRRHILNEFSLIEKHLFSEEEVFYSNIDSIEHLSMDGDRVDLRVHLEDETSRVIHKIPESFVAELSNRIEAAD